MSNVGQLERAAQDCVVALFTDPEKLGYGSNPIYMHAAAA